MRPWVFLFIIFAASAFSAFAQEDLPQPGAGALIPGPDWLPWAPVEEGDIGPFTAPDTVDLSPYFPPPGNQHRQYSCVAWAWAYGVQSALDNAAHGRTYARTDTADRAYTYSPAYIFNELKQLTDSPVVCTSGIDINQQMALAVSIGNCTLLEMPYDTAADGCLNTVPGPVLSSVLGRVIAKPIATPVMLGKTNSRQWIAHLAAGEPLMVLFNVDRTSFIAAGFAAFREHRPFRWTGIGHDDSTMVGHAVACTGYRIAHTPDQPDTVFTFLNSFGTQWGDTGYFTTGTDMLDQYCMAALAFAPRSATLDATDEMDMSDNTQQAKPRNRTKLKPGNAATISGLSLHFPEQGISDSGGSLVLPAPDSSQVPLFVPLSFGRTITIYRRAQRIAVTIRNGHGPFMWFKGPRLLVKTVPKGADDAFLEEQLKTFARFRDQASR
jgi:hypothetical protein